MRPPIEAIVGAIPAPGKKGPPKPKGGAEEDAADGGSDDAEEGDDYSPAEDSAKAFGEALGLKDVDGAAVLDAFRVLLKNADEGEPPAGP
jgi:hypothetical protein